MASERILLELKAVGKSFGQNSVLENVDLAVRDGEFITIGTTQTPTDRVMTPENVASTEKLPMVTAAAPHQDIEGAVVSAGRYKAKPTRVFGFDQIVEAHRAMGEGLAAGKMVVAVN